ncbi:hypothetical protein GE21DRAFT_1271822 [Neurospora crassa]|nr:hypothetical protein GE21DRAFT_1271822 [Neurospora crassa]
MALKYGGKEELLLGISYHDGYALFLTTVSCFSQIKQVSTGPSSLKASIIEERQQTSLNKIKSPQRFNQQRTLRQRNYNQKPKPKISLNEHHNAPNSLDIDAQPNRPLAKKPKDSQPAIPPCHVMSYQSQVLDEDTLDKEMGLRDVSKEKKSWRPNEQVRAVFLHVIHMDGTVARRQSVGSEKENQ